MDGSATGLVPQFSETGSVGSLALSVIDRASLATSLSRRIASERYALRHVLARNSPELGKLPRLGRTNHGVTGDLILSPRALPVES